MDTIWKKVRGLIIREVWERDLRATGTGRASAIRLLRLFYVALREFSEGQLTLRAMSLVYTTILSLVPLLAVSFSVLKAFGVHNQIEPFLLNFLAPLGPKGYEIGQKIIGFVENMRVAFLGSIGLALLIYTVISLIHKIEDSFNYIWKIKRSRTFVQRFSGYMSVILIGPVLIFTALGITASISSTVVVQKVTSLEPFGTAFYVAGKLLPYIFVCAAFTFIYLFIPNTKVKIGSAVTGGLFAGIVWETTGWAFASFIVTSTKYAAIYSGFAIIILFMMWLYISWLVLLLGAEISFYHQYPHFLTRKRETLRLSNLLKERLALFIMFLIGRSFHHDEKPWTLNTLVERLGLPVEPIQHTLSLLERHGLIRETCGDTPEYLPARDLATIKLKEFLDTVRTTEEGTFRLEDRLLSSEVDSIFDRLDDAARGALRGESIRDLVVSPERDH